MLLIYIALGALALMIVVTAVIGAAGLALDLWENDRKFLSLLWIWFCVTTAGIIFTLTIGIPL